MKFVRSFLLLISCLCSILAACSAYAADTGSVSVGESFTMQSDRDCQPLSQYDLLVQGIDSGLHPVGCDPANKKLTFELQRDPSVQNASVDTAWKVMFGSPWALKNSFQRTLNFTLTQSAASGVVVVSTSKLTLQLLQPVNTFVGAVIVIIALYKLIALGKKSGLVRDPGTKLEDRTYSLGRVQMAWWFAIILSSYIFLWVVTGDMTVLSSQALSLMGISGASGLVSAGLDKSKQTVFPAGKGKFFDDLLTDADGVTMHRFQMLVMTVVLGIMFVIYVLTQLKMPDFDANSLALMGISAGTYLGFKVPEQQTNASNGNGSSPTSDDPKSAYAPSPDAPSK